MMRRGDDDVFHLRQAAVSMERIQRSIHDVLDLRRAKARLAKVGFGIWPSVLQELLFGFLALFGLPAVGKNSMEIILVAAITVLTKLVTAADDCSGFIKLFTALNPHASKDWVHPVRCADVAGATCRRHP